MNHWDKRQRSKIKTSNEALIRLEEFQMSLCSIGNMHLCVILIRFFRRILFSFLWRTLVPFLTNESSPGNSVGSYDGCQPRCSHFEIQLRFHSFRHLTKVYATPVHRLPQNEREVYMKNQPVASKDFCVDYLYMKVRKHLGRWTGRRDITRQLFWVKTQYIKRSLQTTCGKHFLPSLYRLDIVRMMSLSVF